MSNPDPRMTLAQFPGDTNLYEFSDRAVRLILSSHITSLSGSIVDNLKAQNINLFNVPYTRVILIDFKSPDFQKTFALKIDDLNFQDLDELTTIKAISDWRAWITKMILLQKIRPLDQAPDLMTLLRTEYHNEFNKYQRLSRDLHNHLYPTPGEVLPFNPSTGASIMEENEHLKIMRGFLRRFKPKCKS